MFDKLYSPESVGLSSDGIADFIEELVRSRLCTHGFMLLRFGRPVAEGYERHFSADRPHRMYSVSKTFVSAAVGILIGEGKLSLEDKVAAFFPDKAPEKLHEYIAQATVRDLLIMATPFNETTYKPDDRDWAKTFFTAAPSHMPGTVFNYDTSGTYILDVIVERITGQPFMDYLYEKALKYIGFSRAWCVKAPEGNSWGGSGVICTLRELAAFSQLFLNGGRAPDGRQLIPETYVKAAVSKQISNETQNKFSSYGCHGYGYQVWRTENGFAFLGMGNQLAVFVPEKELLFVCTSDDQGNLCAREIIFRALNENITKKACDAPLPENPQALERLREAQNTLALPLPEGEAYSQTQEKVNGKTFAMNENPMGISAVRLDFDGGSGAMTYDTPRGRRRLSFDLGRYDTSVFPETHYSGDTIGVESGRGYECHSAAVWAQPEKLIIRTYITDDYFGNLTVTVSFKNGKPSILMTKTAEWFLEEYKGFASAV